MTRRPPRRVQFTAQRIVLGMALACWTAMPIAAQQSGVIDSWRTAPMPRPDPVLPDFDSTAFALTLAPGSEDGTDSASTEAAPMSSIEWLSDSLSQPGVGTEAPVAGSAAVAAVTVTPLDAPSPDGLGLRDAASIGVPPDLWGDSDATELLRLISSFPEDALPAARDAYHDLLVARLDPPRFALANGGLFQARIDALLRMGALAEAQDLLDQADTLQPELFRRAFDMALLSGDENQGCTVLRANPGVAPSLSVRVFCLARMGDWPAAALTLETAEALGQLTPEQGDLLARFLDPEIFEDEETLAPPRQPTPLTFRIHEAIGEPIPTAGLPIAFSHADLRTTASWRARIEAAERLARIGVIGPEKLIEIYNERDPAASGALWDRVATVQALDDALSNGSSRLIGRALGPAVDAMQSADLILPLAEAFGPRLTNVDLRGDARVLALTLGLLSPAYTQVATSRQWTEPRATALAAMARGAVVPNPGVFDDQAAKAAARAFVDPRPEPDTSLTRLRQERRQGEALLQALHTVALGHDADPRDLTGALTYLRSAGLEETARNAALQIALSAGRA